MPTYEYECKNCEHQFELFQSITSEPKAECPKCNGESKRLISKGGGIIFKGSGFYVNDYKDKGAKKETKTQTCDTKGTSPSCNSCPNA